MRVLRIVVLALASLGGLALVAIVLFYSAQPASYRIARTRTIAAPPAAVMAQLSDVRAFAAWDPWPALPGAPRPTVAFSPEPRGVGAWIERRDADGSGARTTIASVTAERVEMSNETRGPLGGGSSTQTFELRAVPAGTEVTWALASDLHGLARLLWPFVGLEARIAPEMEAALSRLDRACAAP